MSEESEILSQSTYKGKLGLFLTGVIQVMFVALNTYQVANGHIIGAWLGGFMISVIWTFNVKRVAFGNNWDRFWYAFGASAGTVLGMLIAKGIY